MHARRFSLTPPRSIALGFLGLILLGALLLLLPVSRNAGAKLSLLDALYTATSAVCVTGLLTVDVVKTFSTFGHVVIACLIELGGLGVTSVGAGVILALRNKISFRDSLLVREGANLSSSGGIIRFLRSVFFTTLSMELIGALLVLPVLLRDYPPLKALGLSLFHAISSFTNAGFVLFPDLNSLVSYRGNLYFNAVTCILVILGGLGFLVLRELYEKRMRLRHCSMHTKLVLFMSATLTLLGAVFLHLTERQDIGTALFHSIAARTAGFFTAPVDSFSVPGLMVLSLLMFVGASPGSMGGGIKTTTLAAILIGIRAAASNRQERAFHYGLPADASKRAGIIALYGIGVIFFGTFCLLLLEPTVSPLAAGMEMLGAFSTVGYSFGITPNLGSAAKLLTIPIMLIGRLGPLTIASVWGFSNGQRVRLPEGELSIG